MEQFQIVPIDKLFESPLNPRHTFNEKKMAELVESIKAKGILTPLIVRPSDGRFEIGAGHRRYRAAHDITIPRPKDGGRSRRRRRKNGKGMKPSASGSSMRFSRRLGTFRKTISLSWPWSSLTSSGMSTGRSS